MSFSSDCASGESGHRSLALQQAGHDFDARERVFHFVRDCGRHLAERHQSIAQALALFELFDLRQVLEEQRNAARAAPLVPDVRQRVADHLARRLETQLGAVGQMAQLECAVQDSHHVGMFRQHDGEVPADSPLGALDLENPRRFAVHLGDVAVSRNRQHAIPHAGDEVPEEAIGLATDGCPARGCTPWCGPPTGRGGHQGFNGERQSGVMRALHGRIKTPQGAKAMPGGTHPKCA